MKARHGADQVSVAFPCVDRCEVQERRVSLIRCGKRVGYLDHIRDNGDAPRRVGLQKVSDIAWVLDDVSIGCDERRAWQRAQDLFDVVPQEVAEVEEGSGVDLGESRRGGGHDPRRMMRVGEIALGRSLA